MSILEKINKTIEILQAKPELTDKEQQILNNLLQQKEIMENNTKLSELVEQTENEGWLNNLKEQLKSTGDTLEGLAELIELGQDLADLVGIAYDGLSSVVSGVGELLGGITDLLSDLRDIFGDFS